MREEYQDGEKLYIIRRNLGLSQLQFDAMGEEEIEDMMERELWVWDNYKV